MTVSIHPSIHPSLRDIGCVCVSGKTVSIQSEQQQQQTNKRRKNVRVLSKLWKIVNRFVWEKINNNKWPQVGNFDKFVSKKRVTSRLRIIRIPKKNKIKPKLKMMYRPNFYESTCLRCNEIVYQVDRVGPLKDFTFFHSGCFKCVSCGTKLTLKTYYNNQHKQEDKEVSIVLIFFSCFQ